MTIQAVARLQALWEPGQGHIHSPPIETLPVMLAPRYSGQILTMAKGGAEFMQVARKSYHDDEFVLTSCLNFHGIYPLVISGRAGWRHSAISSVWNTTDSSRVDQWGRQGYAITSLIKTQDLSQVFLSSNTGFRETHVEDKPSVGFFEMIMAKLEDPAGFNAFHLSLIREMGGNVCLVFSR